MSISLRPWWTWTWPALAFAIMIMTMIFGAAGATAAAAGVVLIAAVFAAVYHAEVVAHLSLSLPQSFRSCSTVPSFLFKRCVIAITFCRSGVVRRSMQRRLPTRSL